MMVPRKSLILAGAALALLGASSGAQSQSGPVFARYTKALRTATLDLATGTVTRGPIVHEKASGSTIEDFGNLDLGGFVAVDTGNSFCEWFDSGIKGYNGNASDLMDNVFFAYCSAKKDPVSGGPGGTIKLGYYENYSNSGVGGPPVKTDVAVFTLTGLPANTGSSSFFGSFRCFFLQVNFGKLICFADGPIGYSWKFVDLGTDGVLGATWTFLSCVQSCSGPGPDGQGMTDFVDQYCPAGALKKSFSFFTLGIGTYNTSINMSIGEALDCPATIAAWTGDGVNVDVLTPVAAIMGSTWSAPVAINHAHGAGGPISIKIRTGTVNGGTISPGGYPTENLIGGTLLSQFLGAHNGTTGDIATQNIPCGAGLFGFKWSSQATVVGGGKKDLSTAEVGRVGSL